MGRSKRIEWQYVEKMKALRKGQWTCKCNFCGHVWGGGLHHIRSHLLSLPNQGVGPCDSVIEDVKEIARRLHADASSDGKDSREAIDALVDDLGGSASQSQGNASLSTHGEGSTHASGSSKSNVNSSKKRRVAQGAGGLPVAFGLQARKQADQALRRLFYAKDVPKWKARSPYFLDMIKAIGNLHTFPEGKISQENGPIRRLKWGVASLIARASVPPIVLPICHSGFEKVMPENYLFGRRPLLPLWFKNISIVVGEPMQFDMPSLRQTAEEGVRRVYFTQHHESPSFPEFPCKSVACDLPEDKVLHWLYSLMSDQIRTVMQELSIKAKALSDKMDSNHR
ncbi:hypothetical protein L7F22_048821 [Adiantum nelumboides]|nr:hypothetical protein [Adiantum nelumboides]